MVTQTRLLLLGSPSIERDGTSVDVDTRKAIALLAYVALEPQRHSRDALAALLWPEYSQSKARAALRRTLSSLTRALNGVGVDADREHIAVDRTTLWIDVDRFHALLAECRTHGHADDQVCDACLEPLAEAACLYRGDLLAGFTLRDSPPFDDWQFLEAERLRNEFAAVLERLQRLHSAQQQWEQAIGYARRWLALDPLNEAAHRALMQIHTWAGQRAAALRQYQKCVQILDQELGVAPQRETTLLYGAIKDNQPSAISRPPSAVSREPSVIDEKPVVAHPSPIHDQGSKIQHPLVGRDHEWATLLNTYAAIGNDGRVIVAEGEAGIGKTRLADALLAHAAAHGATTITMRCYAGETNLAYGPFVEGLRAAIGHRGAVERLRRLPTHWLSEAARLLPELATVLPDLPAAPLLDTPGAQHRLFEGVTETLLAALNVAPPPILFFDDVHWADSASLDLLAYLVRRLRGRPVCVLLTWRSEEIGPTHRLRDLAGELSRSGIATTVALRRLSLTDVLRLVGETAAQQRELPPHFAERLHQETEGLPLFVVEYLASIRQETATAPDTWSVPSGVRDLLRSRLRALDEPSMQMLTTAAVIGRSFDLHTLSLASERREEEIVEALDRVLAHGLIVEMQGSAAPTYDFSHEKLRTLVYDDTSRARRRLLHRRVAQALVAQSEAAPDPRTMAGQIAYHYREAGQPLQAATYFRAAGEYDRSVYANTEALAHFEAALALGHPEMAALQEAIGDLHTLNGEYAEAITSYRTAIAECKGTACVAVEHKLANVYQRRGSWTEAEHHLQAALDALRNSEAHSARAGIFVDLSLVAHQQGNHEAAQRLAQKALNLAEQADDPRALAQAHNILGILANSIGDLPAAHTHYGQSLALADTLGDPSVQAAARNNLALVCKAQGDGEQALTLFEAALRQCIALGDRHREAALHNNLADLLHASGRSTDAIGHLKQAVAIYAEIGVEAGAVQPEIWKLAEW